ncbi:MerR family transcriptional regulator [Streptomyces sp. SID10815]|uniref:MerR family transcriptional regulator n=1 Tax=Streptomyces sp. SID10815 TaxID=2706027 RepID=UPI0013CB7520|nr:MerR family transcriptional regulator [Streptomyces sp. SID10815]NEA47202.1 MerR family transcriptional regulator [Streptomyces sp. SID10815]
MRIGDAAAAVGATPRALRFYEQRGLLPAPRRTGSGQRDYGPEELAVLRVIRRLLALGLTVEDLRGIADRIPLLAADPRPRCGSTAAQTPEAGKTPEARETPQAGVVGAAVVERRIAALDADIERLTRLRDALKAGLADRRGADGPRCSRAT